MISHRHEAHHPDALPIGAVWTGVCRYCDAVEVFRLTEQGVDVCQLDSLVVLAASGRLISDRYGSMWYALEGDDGLR